MLKSIFMMCSIFLGLTTLIILIMSLGYIFRAGLNSSADLLLCLVVLGFADVISRKIYSSIK